MKGWGNRNVIYELKYDEVTWCSKQRYQQMGGKKRKDVMIHFLTEVS